MNMAITSLVTVLSVAALSGLVLAGFKIAGTQPEKIKVPVDKER